MPRAPIYSPEQQYNALLDTMTDMSDSKPRFIGLLYGELGTGKTVLSARVANAIGGRWLYIDTAEEFTTLLVNPRWQHLTKNLVRMRYVGASQLKAVAESINSKREGFNFDGVILDKSTSMADQEVIKVTRARAKDDPSKDPEEPKQPDTNVTTVIMKEAFQALIDTPCHVIHVASVRKDKDHRNIEVTGPGFMPKIGIAVTEPMQLVAHCTVSHQSRTASSVLEFGVKFLILQIKKQRFCFSSSVETFSKYKNRFW